MSPRRWPRRVLEWKDELQNGGYRSVGAPKKSWSSLVTKESWKMVQNEKWSSLNIPKPNITFLNWKKGECWSWLRKCAILPKVWRSVVDFVSA